MFPRRHRRGRLAVLLPRELGPEAEQHSRAVTDARSELMHGHGLVQEHGALGVAP